VRRLTVFLAVCVALTGAPLASSAESGGANHVVIARATADASSHERSGLQVAHAGGPTVTSANIAAALSYACTGCRTVAVAFQAVLVTGDPDTVAPANAAVATNVACTSCTAYAFAYQYVLSTDGPVHLSPEGQQKIGEIREQIGDVATSGSPPVVMDAQLEELKADFKQTIDDELIAAGEQPNGVDETLFENASAP
jgi:putative peptide zinc metalloprotease protein